MDHPALPATSDATFAEDVLAGDVPVLVDFGADWCGPCRMVAPVLREIAAERTSDLRIVSLDVDAHPRTALAYQVMGMPTLILFRGGAAVARIVGARPKAAILRELEPHLAG